MPESGVNYTANLWQFVAGVGFSVTVKYMLNLLRWLCLLIYVANFAIMHYALRLAYKKMVSLNKPLTFIGKAIV